MNCYVRANIAESTKQAIVEYMAKWHRDYNVVFEDSQEFRFCCDGENAYNLERELISKFWKSF